MGTALPFYRPPLDLDGESAFVSEAIDGAVLSHSLSFDSGWLVDVDGYYGGWSTYETTGDQVAEATVSDAVGGQLWVLPPITGLRVGLAVQTYLVEEGLLRPVEDPTPNLFGPPEEATYGILSLSVSF